MKHGPEIQTVLLSAIEVVKARNNGDLPMNDLCLYLACEVVARDQALSDEGKIRAKDTFVQMDANVSGHRRETVLRAEVETLREALEFYATDDAHGAKARSALGTGV